MTFNLGKDFYFCDMIFFLCCDWNFLPAKKQQEGSEFSPCQHKFPFYDGLSSDSLGSTFEFRIIVLWQDIFLWEETASSKMIFLGQIFLPVSAFFLLVGVCLLYYKNLFFCQVISFCDRNTFLLAGNDNHLGFYFKASTWISFQWMVFPFKIATLKRLNFEVNFLPAC